LSVTIEKFVAELGWKTDTNALKAYQKSTDNLVNSALKLGGVIGGLFTGAMAKLLVSTNAATMQNYMLAKSFGMSVSTFNAWGNALRPIGMNAEYVGMSVSFMSRQMGKIKTGQGNEAIKKLGLLGLDKSVANLDSETQYKMIMEAARKLPDQQIAISALSGLIDRTGFNAAKMLGYFRQSGESIDHMLNRYKALNMVDEEGRRGAIAFTKAWEETDIVIGGLKNEFFGLMGQALAPALQSMLDWVAANKELLKSRLKYWAKEIAGYLKTLAGWVTTIVSGFGTLIKKVGGLNNVLAMVGISLAVIKLSPALLALTNVSKIDFSKMGASLKNAGVTASMAAIAFAAYDLMMFFSGRDSVGNQISWDIIGAMERVQLSVFQAFGFTKAQATQAVRLIENDFANMPSNIAKGFTLMVNTIKSAILEACIWITNKLSSLPIIGGTFKDASKKLEGWKGEISNPVATNLGGSKKGFGSFESELNASRVAAYKQKQWIDSTRKSLGYANPVGNINITVNANTNASPKDIAREVHKHVKRAVLHNNSGVER
jgi:hypothetical protein